MSPSLLIADEPTSALDKITQVELLDNLSLIRKKYTMGILCISHESSVVKYLADREVKLEETPIALSNTRVRSKNTQAKTLLTVVDLGYNHHYGGLIQKRGDKISEIKFSLSAGECLGIIGESGSGKSTIAQMLVAHLIPDEGRIELDGNFIDFKNQDEIRSLRSRVQLVMQDGRGSLHPDKLTGELMHEIVAQQIKSKDTKQIILNALHEVGLPAHVLDRKAGNLSGGECLRISIARALLMNPEILICDESTSALDEATRDGIMNLLTGLIENRQLGLILISHDSTVIKNMADKIIVLSNGKIVEAGDMRAIIANPSHDVTKKILSAEATLSEKSPL